MLVETRHHNYIFSRNCSHTESYLALSFGGRVSQSPLDEIVRFATTVLQEGSQKAVTALDGVGMPVYVTNADGILIHFNLACVRFAGRTPSLGHDRWCITHRRLTKDGIPQHFSEYPVAESLRSGRPIRGIVAYAERPNGSRMAFIPYPTPIFDGYSNLMGAVNVFVDLADREKAMRLRNEASRCRRLANSVGDKHTTEVLKRIAEDYDIEANKLDPIVDLWQFVNIS